MRLRALYVAVGMMGLLSGNLHVGARAQDSRGMNPLAVHSFIYDAYPQLQDGLAHRETGLRITGEGDRVSVAVLPIGLSAHGASLMRLAIQLDSMGGIVSLVARGMTVEDARSAALEKTLQMHTQWSDGQVLTYLGALGGESSAAAVQSAMQSILAVKWEEHIGTRPRAGAPSFRWRTRTPSGTVRVVSPRWVFELTTTGRRDQEEVFVVELDPFTLSLVGLYRV